MNRLEILSRVFWKKKRMKRLTFITQFKIDSLLLFTGNRKVLRKMLAREMWLFPDIQYGFRSSLSTTDFLTVVSDKITMTFNRSGATQAVALDISKTFNCIWHSGLFANLSISCQMFGISGQIFGFISSFLSNRRLWVVLDGKSSQEHPVNAGVSVAWIPGPVLFLLYINGHPDNVICNIAINVNDTTFYYKCDQASDLWQQLKKTSESDLTG